VVLNAAYGEIKRIYVNPSCRGQGVARRLLNALESASANAGCKLLLLETGPSSAEALGLYASLGYERRGPFGNYTNDPLSVFMQKTFAA